MSLEHRLDSLRQQSGARSPDTTARGVGEDLTRRLARLQQARGQARSADKRAPLADEELAGYVGGQVLAAGVLLVERLLTVPESRLAGLPDGLPPLPECSALHAGDWAFIDTETTGLAGGSGTLAFMLGVARVIDGRLVVRQYLLSRFAGERAMLEHALGWLGTGTGLISYNGKSFDLPLLKTRTRLAGLEPAAWERPHLDLLHGVRRCFDGQWPDCRLASVEARLLGITRDDDLPGSEAPAAWLAHLQQGEPGRLPGVLTHNQQDLASLGALLYSLCDAHRNPLKHGANLGRVTRAWARQGDPQQARRLLEAAGKDLAASEQLLLARLQQQAGAAKAACELLESLAAAGNSEASERLAKFHEHQTRDLHRATRFARHLPDGPDRRRRLARLTAKVGRNHELPF